MPEDDFAKWTKEGLIKRVKYLEEELNRYKAHVYLGDRPPAKEAPGCNPALTDDGADKPGKKKKDRKPDPSRYSTRLIGLKLAYLGKRYNGFEFQATSKLPTIEEELWKALVKACLVFPSRSPDEIDFGPFEYSKCGRTDRGVSAFGQVVALRVRSSRPVERDEGKTAEDGQGDVEVEGKWEEKSRKAAWDPIADEIQYCRTLNRLLPPDIRILAWAPNLPPNFSARFSCRERQYRYFFTQPAFFPLRNSSEGSAATSRPKDGWLDIEAMRKAAKMFEGLHDFRNFCKVDPGKQLTNFTRRVFEADIVEVPEAGSALSYLNQPEFRATAESGAYPNAYYFHVRGSAFLWHQIRHMVGLLFAVGQGLEPPSIIGDLLDVDRNPRRPAYNMAHEVPLVLWDCIFPALGEGGNADRHHEEDVPAELHMRDAIGWLWTGDDRTTQKGSNLHGVWGLATGLWETWRERKMDELLAGRLLDAVTSRGSAKAQVEPDSKSGGITRKNGSQQLFEGGNKARYSGAYQPVMERACLPLPEEQNDKWARSWGFKSAEAMTKEDDWRMMVKERRMRRSVGGAGVCADVNAKT